MAVVNTLAATIANETAIEPWKAAGVSAEVKYTTSGIVSVAAADSDTSTYRFCKLPSHARLVSAKIFTAGITGGTSFDLGIYADGGAVKSVACYSSAVDLSSALVGTEIAFEARALANHRKKIWEDAGDSSDAGGLYDLVLTANTVGSATADVLIIVDYTID